MRRLAAVALREITERRFVLAAAAAAAVLPFLVPLLPAVPGGDGPAARSVTALVLACTFGAGGALLVGASVVGRELAEKRLSFHFSRPLSSAVVWGGKLAGGLALVLLAELVVYVPASLAGGAFPSLAGTSLPWAVLGSLLLCPVPLFLLAWVGSVALRSRSPWLVVDFLLLAGLPALLFLLVRRLVLYGALPEPSEALLALGVLLAALLAATLAQVVAGRTDARRGHGAQSLALWGVLLAALAVGALAAERAIDPGVRRLAHAWASPAGTNGERVLVRGSAKPGGRSQALYVRDLRTGAERLLPAAWEAVTSADGSRATVVHSRPFSLPRAVELEAIDLGTGASDSLDLPEWPDGVALSADGRRLAVLAGGICRVVDLPSLRLVASARVPDDGDWIRVPHFVSSDRVRIVPVRRGYRRAARTAAPESLLTDPAVFELDAAAKTVVALARYPIASIPYERVKPLRGLPAEPYVRLTPSPDLTRVLAVAFGAARSVRLLEASTGRVLYSVDGPERAGGAEAAFLADGRAVVAEWVAGGRRLVVLSRDGERQSETPLPAGRKRVRFGWEPAEGALAVGLGLDLPKDDWMWSLADLASGRLRPLGVDPLFRRPWGGDPVVPAPGSPATRLAHEKGTGRLVLFDPATGEAKPLTRGFAARK